MWQLRCSETSQIRRISQFKVLTPEKKNRAPWHYLAFPVRVSFQSVHLDSDILASRQCLWFILLSSLPPPFHHLHHLRLLQTRASLCTAVRFQRRLHGELKGWCGRRGIACVRVAAVRQPVDCLSVNESASLRFEPYAWKLVYLSQTSSGCGAFKCVPTSKKK